MRRSGFLALAALASCARGAAPRSAAAPGTLPPVRIAALGDSLAFGTGASTPENGFIFRAFERVRRERPDSEIDNFAMGGSTAADVLRLQVARLRRRFDIVIICVGGNDVVRHIDPAAFGVTYAKLVAAVRLRQPQAQIVCCGVPNVGRSPLFGGPEAGAISGLAHADDAQVRSVAMREHAGFVDLYAVTSIRHSDESRFLSDDRFHPSDEGYATFADALAPVVLRAAARR
jgi:lysophospholipase L1-like esterase